MLKVLAGDYRLPLKIAHAAIQEWGVTSHMGHGAAFGDMAARLADDEGQFALVVKVG